MGRFSQSQSTSNMRLSFYLSIIFAVTSTIFLNSFFYENLALDLIGVDEEIVSTQVQLLKTKDKIKGKGKVLTPQFDDNNFTSIAYLTEFYALVVLHELHSENKIKRTDQLFSPTLISKFIYFYLSDTSPPLNS